MTSAVLSREPSSTSTSSARSLPASKTRSVRSTSSGMFSSSLKQGTTTDRSSGAVLPATGWVTLVSRCRSDALLGEHADPGFLHVQVLDAELLFPAPGFDLVLRVAMRVQRVIPVEVGDHVGLPVHRVVPIAF